MDQQNDTDDITTQQKDRETQEDQEQTKMLKQQTDANAMQDYQEQTPERSTKAEILADRPELPFRTEVTLEEARAACTGAANTTPGVDGIETYQDAEGGMARHRSPGPWSMSSTNDASSSDTTAALQDRRDRHDPESGLPNPLRDQILKASKCSPLSSLAHSPNAAKLPSPRLCFTP
ncbi:hypothetical protein E4U19_002550 [Claviceps sp. Clav32 group G5]|nr:hypothetical protein E4U19_002550 [Claviceps sp. Clav32 group G5]